MVTSLSLAIFFYRINFVVEDYLFGLGYQLLLLGEKILVVLS